MRRRAIPGFSVAESRSFVARPERGGGIDLLVDAQAVARGPIRRDLGPAFLPSILEPGKRVEDQATMRRGFRTVLGEGGHLALHRFAGGRPSQVVGCGNLGLNVGVRAFQRGAWHGAVGHEGAAIAVFADGRGRAVPPSAPPGNAAFVLTGPSLVRNGRAEVPNATTFADPRHLLLFPFLGPEGGPAVDMGMDRLLTDPAAYEAAVRGEVIELPLSVPSRRGMSSDLPIEQLPLPKAALVEALKRKGYRSSFESPPEPGRYRVLSDRLEIRFLPGIYPHHALVLDGAGLVCSVLVTGKSNRVGVTIAEFSQDLAEWGAREAILLDNGGDVGLYDCRQEAFLIPPSEPDRQGLWPISACVVYGRIPTDIP